MLSAVIVTWRKNIKVYKGEGGGGREFGGKMEEWGGYKGRFLGHRTPHNRTPPHKSIVFYCFVLCCLTSTLPSKNHNKLYRIWKYSTNL